MPLEGGPAAIGDKVTLGVRPEHLIEGETEGGFNLAGEVDAVEHLGESSLIHMHLDDGTVVIARVPGDSPTIPGSRLTMSAPVSALQVFGKSGTVLERG